MNSTFIQCIVLITGLQVPKVTFAKLAVKFLYATHDHTIVNYVELFKNQFRHDEVTDQTKTSPSPLLVVVDRGHPEPV